MALDIPSDGSSHPGSRIEEALAFDDVLMVPGYSQLLPAAAETRTRLTREILLNIPLISAAMDTVTESAMAIAMAQLGGIGVIHKNMTPDEQATQVRQVKKFESGMVINPITIHPDQTLADVRALKAQHHISGIPVVEPGSGRLVGILTNRDVRFATDPTSRVYELMTRDGLVTVQPPVRPRGGEAPAAPPPHREAAGGGRGVSLHRPDHRQGHGQGAGASAGEQGRAGPAAGRRGHRRRSRTVRLAPVRWSPPRPM